MSRLGPDNPDLAPTSPGHLGRAALANIVDDLKEKWGLQLEPPPGFRSPNKRREWAAADPNEAPYRKLAVECMRQLNYIVYKDYDFIAQFVVDFEDEATNITAGRRKKAITPAERVSLLQCMYGIIHPTYKSAKLRETTARLVYTREGSPSLSQSPTSAHRPATRLTEPVEAIPFSLSAQQMQKYDVPCEPRPPAKQHKKRSSDEFEAEDVPEDAGNFKKPRVPKSTARQVNQVIDRGFTRDNEPHSERRGSLARTMSNFSANTSFNANTSFTSVTSAAPTVFSAPPGSNQSTNYSFSSAGTQRSLADVVPGLRHKSSTQDLAAFETSTQATHYDGESSFDVDDFEMVERPQGVEGVVLSPPEATSPSKVVSPTEALKQLREALGCVFPEIPKCLERLSFHVRYEIVRVFLHAQVPVSKLIAVPESCELNNYDTLWHFLESLTCLKGKPFPAKCSKRVWAMACHPLFRKDKDPNEAITVSWDLEFTESFDSQSIFRIRLKPLKIDRSNRLSRRFGSDRFAEMEVPEVKAATLPKPLDLVADEARDLIMEWLGTQPLNFLGRKYRSFFCKPKERPKRVSKEDAQRHTEPTFIVYLFATDGTGSGKRLPGPEEKVGCHTFMRVEELLSWIRPPCLNQQQPFLKLFARTGLALSKTFATVVLERHQVFYKKDIRSRTGEVMTDGSGRMSVALALAIRRDLKLAHLPSAFQGRFGPAKGLWTVSDQDKTGEMWIELYESQCKWVEDPVWDDPAHRTFEVSAWSNPCRSAALNFQFLPILAHRDDAHKGRIMRDAIGRILTENLKHEIECQRAAMDDPRAFRKWVRDTNYGVKERLAHGEVVMQGGMPTSLEEKLNMLLDAGFDPKKLKYLQDLARKSYSDKCEQLKERMHIIVGRSAYMYMVPDFTGTLKEGEVHVCFSGAFEDDVSGYSETLLDGHDVLVSRSPAHFSSDVQKVRAVYRPELKHLKDVVVFSTQGDISLATLLSGGDFDGDQAWVCWEPALVDAFENSVTPVQPDLVKEGYMSKELTTYRELEAASVNPVSEFIKQSLSFNLRKGFLGICTNFKESLCYAQKSVCCEDYVALSTLLSNLVDQAKQGYLFTEEDWARFKQKRIKVKKINTPAYKGDDRSAAKNLSFISDWLKFKVAHDIVEATKVQFHQSLESLPEKAQNYDYDLVAPWKAARELAEKSPAWQHLLSKLEADVKLAYQGWAAAVGKNSNNDPSALGFGAMLDQHYAKFCSIMPDASADAEVLKTLNLVGSDPSGWELLRASTVFKEFHWGHFPWWMCGRELCVIKAMRVGMGGRAITKQIYAMLKPDATFVRLMDVGTDEAVWAEATQVGEVDGSEWDEGSGDEEYYTSREW